MLFRSRPVTGTKDVETTKFWEASPSGKLELGCANLEAAKFFELSKEYYLDFMTPEELAEKDKV